ncbi:hypothetical protein VP01_2752g2 [Puccinia sorghi]|uniref:Uncharacterized protein n=1 Tax=Puccinia sorghi TaxID=27349 RepID=A0A0L6V332_9BASI|nr:hypothetical protein VP01_2752g2 [Puccinia sorghi]
MELEKCFGLKSGFLACHMLWLVTPCVWLQYVLYLFGLNYYLNKNMWSFHGRCHNFLEWSWMLVNPYILNTDGFYTSVWSISCYDRKLLRITPMIMTSFVADFIISQAEIWCPSWLKPQQKNHVIMIRKGEKLTVSVINYLILLVGWDLRNAIECPSNHRTMITHGLSQFFSSWVIIAFLQDDTFLFQLYLQPSKKGWLFLSLNSPLCEHKFFFLIAEITPVVEFPCLSSPESQTFSSSNNLRGVPNNSCVDTIGVAVVEVFEKRWFYGVALDGDWIGLHYSACLMPRMIPSIYRRRKMKAEKWKSIAALSEAGFLTEYPCTYASGRITTPEVSERIMRSAISYLYFSTVHKVSTGKYKVFSLTNGDSTQALLTTSAFRNLQVLIWNLLLILRVACLKKGLIRYLSKFSCSKCRVVWISMEEREYVEISEKFYLLTIKGFSQSFKELLSSCWLITGVNVEPAEILILWPFLGISSFSQVPLFSPVSLAFLFFVALDWFGGRLSTVSKHFICCQTALKELFGLSIRCQLVFMALDWSFWGSRKLTFVSTGVTAITTCLTRVIEYLYILRYAFFSNEDEKDISFFLMNFSFLLQFFMMIHLLLHLLVGSKILIKGLTSIPEEQISSSETQYSGGNYGNLALKKLYVIILKWKTSKKNCRIYSHNRQTKLHIELGHSAYFFGEPEVNTSPYFPYMVVHETYFGFLEPIKKQPVKKKKEKRKRQTLENEQDGEAGMVKI